MVLGGRLDPVGPWEPEKEFGFYSNRQGGPWGNVSRAVVSSDLYLEENTLENIQTGSEGVGEGLFRYPRRWPSDLD